MPVGAGYAWSSGRRAGNHGVVIPRDRALLHEMYWTRRMTTVEMAHHFNVTHKSMCRAMDQVGVPRRKKGSPESKITRPCKDCGGVVVKMRHSKNGSMYGTRCAECRRKHYNALNRSYYTVDPKKRTQRNRAHKAWYDREFSNRRYGEYGECHRVLMALEKEIRKQPWEERARDKGYYDNRTKQQRRIG